MNGDRESGRFYHSGVILVITLFAVLVFAILYPMPSPLITTICENTGWDLRQAGNLVSVFALVMAFATFTTSGLIDHLGVKRTALVACAFAGVGGVMSFFGGVSYPFHYTARLISGIGYGIFTPLTPAIISQWFCQSRQPFLQGLRATADFAGGSLAYFIIVPIAQWVHSWQAAFGILGLACVAVLLLYGIFYPQAEKPARSKGEGPGPYGRSYSLLRALRQKWVWMIALSQLFKGITYNAFTIYLPTFLEIERGYTRQAASHMTGILQIAGLFTGLVAGMISSGRGGRKVLGWPMVLLIVIGGVMAVSAEHGILIALGTFLVGSGVCGHMVFYTTVPGDITGGKDPGLVAASLALTLGLSFAVSYAIPTLLQLLLDWGMTMQKAMILLILPCLAAIPPMVLIRETGPAGKDARSGILPYATKKH